jgi:hypothetical protein
MVSKTRTHRILGGLVLAHVVLNAIAQFVMLTRTQPGDALSDVFLLYAIFMLGPSQATLLALWVMLGGGKFLWRALSTAFGVFLYLWCFQRCFQRADSDWLIITFGNLAVMGVLLLLARLAGVELTKDPKAARGPSQFTIRDMLMWTTALAIILGALHYLPKLSFIYPSAPETVATFGSFALVAAAALHCSLGGRWLLARILGTPFAIGVGAYLLAISIRTSFSMWYFALLLGLMAAWLLGSLLLVRLAGYRLTWRWWFTSETTPRRPPRPGHAPCGSDG